MAIIIEILESKNEVISGIPETVSIVPVDNISFYYSLDGEDPGPESLLADEIIYLPTDGSSVEIRVLGFMFDAELGVMLPATDLFGKVYRPNPYLDSRNKPSIPI